MAASEQLSAFVKAALAQSIPRAEIEAVLRKSGWPVGQVRSALDGFADVEFAIPVPRPQPYLDAREAFMYLVLFSTLYLSAYHLGSLLFDIINLTFRDPADAPLGSPLVAAPLDMDDAQVANYLRQSIRWSISSLIVAFPVFFYMSWLVARDLAANPSKRHSKVRRWLTYLTLFVAASVLIGDVITLVYNLLGGEIATRFLLKVLVVGFIAGTVFWYYLSDIRREE
jgi:hypothetical protein